MYKTYLLFLNFILFSSLGIAQDKDKPEHAYLKVKTGEETITYEFNSIIDFNENSEKILNEVTVPTFTNKKEKEPNITIEISITYHANHSSTTITGSVTTLLSSIVAEVKKLRTQLLAIVIG
ncbi:hypothetical protein [Flavobacterium sp.]|uniref:hypothetical protein n=1 Tax=Flavobacterium sp. TaxID=239 RepID=UPI00391B8D3C